MTGACAGTPGSIEPRLSARPQPLAGTSTQSLQRAPTAAGRTPTRAPTPVLARVRSHPHSHPRLRLRPTPATVPVMAPQRGPRQSRSDSRSRPAPDATAGARPGPCSRAGRGPLAVHASRPRPGPRHAWPHPSTALTDLPSFDTSAMDGWAVAGPGPWDRPGERGRQSRPGILAGHVRRPRCPTARPSGSPPAPASRRTPPPSSAASTAAPDEAKTAAVCTPPRCVPRPGHPPARPGVPQRRPTAARRHLVTPAVLGLAAAAGYDELRDVPRPRVEVLVLGRRAAHRGTPARRTGPGRAGPDAAALAAGARRRGHRRTPARRRRRRAAHADHRRPPPIWSSPQAARPRARSTTSTPSCAGSAPNCWWTGSRCAPATPCCWPGYPGGPAPRRAAGQPPGGRLRAAHPRRAPAAHPGRPPGARAVPRSPLRDAVHGHPHDTRLVPVVPGCRRRGLPVPRWRRRPRAAALQRPGHAARHRRRRRPRRRTRPAGARPAGAANCSNCRGRRRHRGREGVSRETSGPRRHGPPGGRAPRDPPVHAAEPCRRAPDPPGRQPAADGAAGAGRDGAHRLRRPRRLQRQRRRHRRLPRRLLLRDRHPLHHRIRRHHPVQRQRPADQYPRSSRRCA